MSDIIERSRFHISSLGGCELKAIATNDGFKELFLQRQEVLRRMHDAKIKAVAEVTNLFKDELNEIDKQYSLMLTMIGDNAED